LALFWCVGRCFCLHRYFRLHDNNLLFSFEGNKFLFLFIIYFLFIFFYPFTVLDSNVVRLGKQRCRCLVFLFLCSNLLTGQKNVCCLIIHSVSVGLKLLLFFFKEKKWKTTSTMLFLLVCCRLQSETDLRQSHCTLSELDDQHFNTSKWRERERERADTCPK
jgi:hypothetical protein